MGTSRGTVSNLSARLICGAAAEAGIASADLLAEVDLSPEILTHPEGKIPYDKAKQLWEIAARKTGDSNFGLHASLELRPDAFGLMGYAIRSSRNGAEAVNRLISYANRYYADLDFSLDENGSLARLHHRFLSDEDAKELSTRQASDFILASFIKLAREFTGVDVHPILVTFQHAAPETTDAYDQIFGAPVLFSQPSNTVVFERQHLSLKLLGHNPEVLEILDRNIEAILAEMPTAPEVTLKASKAVVDAIQSGGVALEAIAKTLRMSTRSLQRKLLDEGTSHRELVNGLREELAERYLAERSLTIDQVAFHLGFRQTTTFRRAFQRWTGLTPSAYRERLFQSRDAPH